MKKICYLILPLIFALTGCGAAIDWLPDKSRPQHFSFAEQNDVETNRTVTSEEVTVTGNEVPAEISVENGEYAIGGEGGDGVFTSKPGKVSAGQTVRVRHTSASVNESAVSTVVTIGGVRGVFTSITRSLDSDPTGTLVLTAVPEFVPGPSDDQTVTGDLSLELKNLSATASYSAEVDFVGRDAAGKAVYTGTTQSPFPFEPGETSAFVAPVSLSASDYARIVKWQLTAIRRVDPAGS